MNSNMKWCSAVLAAGVLLGGIGWQGTAAEASAAKAAVVSQKAAKSEVALKWNGKAIAQKGLLIQGSVYVPAAAVRDALGVPLKYDKKNKAYTLGKGYNQVTAAVYDAGEIGISVNGLYVGEPGGQMINGRLYIPFKVLSEYMGVQGQWNPSLKTLSMSAKKQNDITIGSETLKKSDKKASIEIRYPVISGLGNKDVQAKMNAVFKKHAETFLESSLKGLKEVPAPQNGVPYEYKGDFVVHYNAKGLLSLTSYEYTYSGGAHGMTYRTSHTFSLKDGKELKLGDVINLTGNKQKLNDLVLNKMKKEGGYLGGFKGVPADADFYLKDNAAVLYFQLYEYTAYAYGFPEFELPLKAWK